MWETHETRVRTKRKEDSKQKTGETKTEESSPLSLEERETGGNTTESEEPEARKGIRKASTMYNRQRGIEKRAIPKTASILS